MIYNDITSLRHQIKKKKEIIIFYRRIFNILKFDKNKIG